MKLFIWGTLTSVGGGANKWMIYKLKARYIEAARMQGMCGEIYDVPDVSMPELDSFERRYGYIRLTADVERDIHVYVFSPQHDRYYSGDLVEEELIKAGKANEIVNIGPEVEEPRD